MENLQFEEAMSKLESILDDLEKNGDKMDQEELGNKINEADDLKNYCKTLLRKEKSDIISVAKENDIPLSEIGIDEEEDDWEETDEDWEEDDEETSFDEEEDYESEDSTV
jgi:hypothetical protein